MWSPDVSLVLLKLAVIDMGEPGDGLLRIGLTVGDLIPAAFVTTPVLARIRIPFEVRADTGGVVVVARSALLVIL